MLLLKVAFSHGNVCSQLFLRISQLFLLLCIFVLLLAKKGIHFKTSCNKECGSTFTGQTSFQRTLTPGKFSPEHFYQRQRISSKLILQNRIEHSRYASRFSGISFAHKAGTFLFLPCPWKQIFIPPFCTHDLGRDELSDKGSVHSDEIAFHRALRTKRALSRSRAVGRN